MGQPILHNRIAVVTGAASGIGKAIATLYLEHGARVLAVDRSPIAVPEGQSTFASLALDISAPDSAGCISDAVKDAFDGVDILVNNAAICLRGGIEDQSLEDWERTMAVNVTAPFRITQALLPMLKRSGAGRIINLGSIMSDMAGANMCGYGTAKHAIAGFTKSLATDLGKYGITANYLQPGSIATGMSPKGDMEAAFVSFWEGRAPLGRIGDPQDVAWPALMLAADGGGFISGAGIRVCGGAMARY